MPAAAAAAASDGPLTRRARLLTATTVMCHDDHDHDHDHGHSETEEIDFAELNSAGMLGAVASDLHDALAAYQEADYQMACLKVLKVGAALGGFEGVGDFLGFLDDGNEIRGLLEQEKYLQLLAKIIKLIPPTGEPEIDIPLGIMKTLEFVHLQHSYEALKIGKYRLALHELGDAVLPQSMERAVRNANFATVAPVAAGITAGYYGYKGRFGYGMRSNFLLTSFAVTFSIRIFKRYRVNFNRRRNPVSSDYDEHLVLT